MGRALERRPGDDQLPRHHAVLHDLAVVVDVLDEAVEGAQPLRQATLDLSPLGGRDDARDQVERERPVHHRVGIVRAGGVEGDPLLHEDRVAPLTGGCQALRADALERLHERRRVRSRHAGRLEHLVVEARRWSEPGGEPTARPGRVIGSYAAPAFHPPESSDRGATLGTLAAMSLVERQFRAMGSMIRLLIAPSADRSVLPPGAMAVVAQTWLVRFEHTLSRFMEDSELSQLNRDPREQVPATPLMREAVHAALWAAERSGGLVDPTLAREVVDAGYATSRAGLRPAPLSDALAEAPPRRPAGPRADSAWRSFQVLDDSGSLRRPPGVMLDAGGIGKGLAADMLARRLAPYQRFAIDCGGDVRLGGTDAANWPMEIEVRHPLSGDAAAMIQLGEGGVATSGIDSRVWKRPDGSFAHHLIDPATGAPAWTGLVGATALAPTAVEAETLAKAALLSGPDGARGYLAEHGGLVVHEEGHVERIGPFPAPG